MASNSSPGVAVLPAPEEHVDVDALGARRRSARVAGHATQPPPPAHRQHSDAERAAKRKADRERRDAELEQIVPARPGDDGVAAAPFRVKIHPSAAALVHLHAHLAHTEVIGYLGGVVCAGREGEAGGAASRQTVYVLEAFPVQHISAKELAREGRSAANEVEMEPESACEVQMRIAGKSMSIVGWYHSHPYFSACPSELDVDNQRNQQTMLFRDAPYVAAICAPFWEELPDSRAKLDMFYVDCGTACPVQVEYETSLERPPVWASGSEDFYSSFASSGTREVGSGATRDAALRKQIDSQLFASLENEVADLVANYAKFPRRVDLHGEWRGGVSVLDKLRDGLELSLFGGPGLAPQPQVAPTKDEVKCNGVASSQGGGVAASSSKSTLTPGNSRLHAASPDGKQPAAESCISNERGGLAVDKDAASVNLLSKDGARCDEANALLNLLRNLVAMAGDAWCSADAEKSARVAANKKGKKRKGKS